MGTAGGFGAKKEEKEMYYTFTSYIYPPTIFKYDIATGKSSVIRKPACSLIPPSMSRSRCFTPRKTARRVPDDHYPQKGPGAERQKPYDALRLRWLRREYYARLQHLNIVLLENGGMYAVANLRGGGEYGENWHKAGTKLQKAKRVRRLYCRGRIPDQKKYTSKDHLAISGGSNGGLLVGAVMTQRPDLLQGCLPGRGRDGYAALQQVYGRRGLGLRLWHG